MKRERASSDFIKRINASKLCSGCGLCEVVAGSDKVRMCYDKDGFLRPRYLESTGKLSRDQNALLERICPGLSAAPCLGDNYNRTWGAISKIVVGWAADPEIRRMAASGGALTATLIHLLNSRRIDGVVQVRQAGTNLLKTEVVISTSREQILKCMGSLYMPSAPLSQLNDLGRLGGRYAVVAKPCDIQALRDYLMVNPQLADRVTVLIAFMCGGVPSIKGTEQILREYGITLERIEQLRYRGDGWPGYLAARDQNQQACKLSYSESWGRYLNKHLQLRCKVCPDGIGEHADLVFGDGWYLTENNEPSFSEREGRSLIIARNAKGLEILNSGISAGTLQVDSFSLEELNLIQPHQRRRRALALSRVLALRLFGMETPDYHRYRLFSLSKQVGVSGNLST